MPRDRPVSTLVDKPPIVIVDDLIDGTLYQCGNRRAAEIDHRRATQERR